MVTLTAMVVGAPVYDATNATKDFAALVGKLNNHSLSPIEENFLDWQLREKLEDKCGIPLVKELLLYVGVGGRVSSCLVALAHIAL